MKYLLDTNVISETRKRRPHRAVLAWLHARGTADVCLSAMTLFELQVGVERTRLQNVELAASLEGWIESLAGSMPVLPLDGAVCRETARLMVGRSYDLVQDAFIASTARVHGLTIATRNLKDFAVFKIATINPFANSH